jgi:hypothetical protein
MANVAKAETTVLIISHHSGDALSSLGLMVAGWVVEVGGGVVDVRGGGAVTVIPLSRGA